MKIFILFLTFYSTFGVSVEKKSYCDDKQESKCSTKMCFYSIDHEKGCYRTGCATEELCSGRGHNECFISDGVQTCCCVDSGCATSHEEFSDCFDEPRNGTDIKTSTLGLPPYHILFGTSNHSRPIIESTTWHSPIEKNMQPRTTDIPTIVSSILTYLDSNISEEFIENGTETISLVATSESPLTVSEEAITEYEQNITVPTLEPQPMSVTPTQQARQTQTFSTSASKSVSQPPQTKFLESIPNADPEPTMSETSTTITTDDVTISSSDDITISTTDDISMPTSDDISISSTDDISILANHQRNGHILQSLLGAHTQTIPGKTSDEVTVTDRQSVTTNASSLTVTLPLIALTKKLMFTHEPQDFIQSATMKDKLTEYLPTSTDSGNTKSSSITSLNKYTTLTPKNEEQSSAMIPWWSAVLSGFIVSIIIAWVVVFFLRRKKKQETKNVVGTTEKDAELIDPLLKTVRSSNSPRS